MNDTFPNAQSATRFLDPLGPAAPMSELGLPDVLGQLDAALNRLDREISETVGRLAPVLRPVPPSNPEAARVTSGQPPSPVTERLYEFLRSVESMADAVSRTRDRLDF